MFFFLLLFLLAPLCTTCQLSQSYCSYFRWLGPSLTHNATFRLACRLPLCCYAVWSLLAASELQLSAATLLWLYHRAASLPSWREFNCLQSAMVGKAARLSIYWQDAACRLVIPLRQVGLQVAQLYKYHHQSKLVWKQHCSTTSSIYLLLFSLAHNILFFI